MINLLPSDFTAQKQEAGQKIFLLFVGMTIIIVLLFLVFSYMKISVKNQIVNRKLEIANQQLRSVNEEVELIEKIKKKKQELTEQLNRRKKIMGSQIDWHSNLRELRNLMPGKSWLEEYEVNEDNQFRLSGYSLTRDKLEEIVSRFKTSPYFNEISLDIVNKKELVKEGYYREEVVHYEISGVLASRSDADERME